MNKKHLLYFSKTVTTFVLFTFAITNAMAATSVPINEKLWARIDKVNETLQKAGKPAPTKVIAEMLAETTAILRDPEFDPDYQNIRANAFNKDFTQADALSKRGEPAFAIHFDGDYDFEQMSWEYFKSLAAPGSEAADFFKLYPGYLHALQADWPSSCDLPFDFPEMSDPERVPGKITPQIVLAWKHAAQKWQEPFFKNFAQRAVQCFVSR